eukprot:gene2121-18166_t
MSEVVQEVEAADEAAKRDSLEPVDQAAEEPKVRSEKVSPAAFRHTYTVLDTHKLPPSLQQSGAYSHDPAHEPSYHAHAGMLLNKLEGARKQLVYASTMVSVLKDALDDFSQRSASVGGGQRPFPQPPHPPTEDPRERSASGGRKIPHASVESLVYKHSPSTREDSDVLPLSSEETVGSDVLPQSSEEPLGSEAPSQSSEEPLGSQTPSQNSVEQLVHIQGGVPDSELFSKDVGKVVGVRGVGEAIGSSSRGVGEVVGGRGVGEAIGSSSRGVGEVVGGRGVGEAIGSSSRGAGEVLGSSSRGAGKVVGALDGGDVGREAAEKGGACAGAGTSSHGAEAGAEAAEKAVNKPVQALLRLDIHNDNNVGEPSPHHKLICSPGRRKSPLETKRASEQRQARAEAARGALEGARKARVERAKQRGAAALRLQEDRSKSVDQKQNRFEEKIARSTELRHAHLANIKQAMRAVGSAFTRLDPSHMHEAMHAVGRAFVSHARHRKRLREALARQQDAAAAFEETQERRRMLDVQRSEHLAARLAEKERRKKQALRGKRSKHLISRAMKGGNIELALKEATKERQQALWEQAATQERELSSELRSQIEERLKEAQARRQQHLEMIRDRAALGGAKQDSDGRGPRLLSSDNSVTAVPSPRTAQSSRSSPRERLSAPNMSASLAAGPSSGLRPAVTDTELLKNAIAANALHKTGARRRSVGCGGQDPLASSSLASLADMVGSDEGAAAGTSAVHGAGGGAGALAVHDSQAGVDALAVHNARSGAGTSGEEHPGSTSGQEHMESAVQTATFMSRRHSIASLMLESAAMHEGENAGLVVQQAEGRGAGSRQAPLGGRRTLSATSADAKATKLALSAGLEPASGKMQGQVARLKQPAIPETQGQVAWRRLVVGEMQAHGVSVKSEGKDSGGGGAAPPPPPAGPAAVTYRSTDRSITAATTARNKTKGMRRRAAKVLAKLDMNKFKIPESGPANVFLESPEGQALVFRWHRMARHLVHVPDVVPPSDRLSVPSPPPHPKGRGSLGGAAAAKGAAALAELSRMALAAHAARPSGILFALSTAIGSGDYMSVNTVRENVDYILDENLVPALARGHVRENVDYMLAENLVPSLARAAMREMDHHNGMVLLAGSNQINEGRAGGGGAQYLAELLEVLALVARPKESALTAEASPARLATPSKNRGLASDRGSESALVAEASPARLATPSKDGGPASDRRSESALTAEASLARLATPSKDMGLASDRESPPTPCSPPPLALGGYSNERSASCSTPTKHSLQGRESPPTPCSPPPLALGGHSDGRSPSRSIPTKHSLEGRESMSRAGAAVAGREAGAWAAGAGAGAAAGSGAAVAGREEGTCAAGGAAAAAGGGGGTVPTGMGTTAWAGIGTEKRAEAWGEAGAGTGTEAAAASAAVSKEEKSSPTTGQGSSDQVTLASNLESQRQLLVSFYVSCGIVHRASDLFSLLDQPQGGNLPIPPEAMQALTLLEAMTAWEPPPWSGASRRLRIDRKWSPTMPNATAISLAFQTSKLDPSLPTHQPQSPAGDQTKRRFLTPGLGGSKTRCDRHRPNDLRRAHPRRTSYNLRHSF